MEPAKIQNSAFLFYAKKNLTEHQIFLCEATHQAAAMGNGEAVRIFFLEHDTTPAEKAEIDALGLKYVGVFGCINGQPDCRLAPGADKHLAMLAGQEYGGRLAEMVKQRFPHGFPVYQIQGGYEA